MSLLRVNQCLFFCSCLYFRSVLTDHYYFIFDEDSFNRVLAVEQGYKDVVLCYVKGLGIKGDPSFFFFITNTCLITPSQLSVN